MIDTPVRPSPRDVLIPSILGVLICTVIVLPRTGYSDFHQFFAAGELAGTGHLYDWNALRPLEAGYQAVPVPFGRIPVYAEAFKALTLLPRRAAQITWFCINLAAIGLFVLVSPLRRRCIAALALCWSVPLFIALFLGQDTCLFLLFIALGFWLMDKQEDVLAGLAFSLAANKFHLAMAVPVFLLASRRWKVLLGGGIGLAALIGVSFLIEGPGWPAQLLELSKSPEFSPNAGKMPNLHGVLYRLSFDAGLLEVLLTIAILTGVYALAKRASTETTTAVVLAAGLLCSVHAYLHDAVVLIPLAIISLQSRVRAVRYAALLFCISPLYVLLSSAVVQVVIVGFAAMALTITIYDTVVDRGSDPVQGRPREQPGF